MTIRKIEHNREQFRELLLLADEQWDMVERYLYTGDLFAMFNGETAVCVCVVTANGGGEYEIKNLATHPEYQKRGYAREMVAHVIAFYRSQMKTLLVGTGDSPLTLPFYHKLGFAYSHRVKDFFIQNYDHPIVEGGVVLKDMVYLKHAFPED